MVWLYKGDPPEPIEAATGEIDENMEGALVKISGEIIQKSGNTWRLDDGSGETRVVFQETARIQKPAATTGDWVAITGLVSETHSGYRVLPRYTDDSQKTEAKPEGGKILGDSEQKNNFERFDLPGNNYSGQALRYLLGTAAAFTIIAAILFIRARRQYQKALATTAKALAETQKQEN